MTISLIIIVICVLAEGFFSGTEIAIINANRFLLTDKASKGNLGARIALSYLEKPEMLLGSTLVGTNLCTVTGAMTATLFMMNSFEKSGELYAILFFWPITLLIGEILPKTVYQANADRITPVAAIILRIFTFALYPVIWLFTSFSNLMIKFLREKGNAELIITRSDVAALARRKSHTDDIDPEEKRIIKRMFDFSSTKISEVMVPLINIIAMEYSMTAKEAVNFAGSNKFSRFPVFKERVDQIVGVVDTYSLIDIVSIDDPLRDYISKPLFVPESMSIKALLSELRIRGLEMAIVVDEYGGAVGLITIEDVLEEVVGDIEDEFDKEESLYKRIGPSSYIFLARTEIDFINEKFDFKIPAGEYETLGGYLLERFNRIPRHNETLVEGKLHFTVMNPTNKNLNEIRIDIRTYSKEIS